MELFDKVLHYDLEKEMGDFYRGTFGVGGMEYEVFLEFASAQTVLDSLADEWGHPDADIEEVVSAAKAMAGEDDMLMYVQFQTHNGETETTGTGNEFLVFSTVMRIINDVMRKENPEWMIMSAKESNRASLYDKMIKRMVPQNNIFYYPSPDMDTNFLVRLK
jgi:hypothetical protein